MGEPYLALIFQTYRLPELAPTRRFGGCCGFCEPELSTALDELFIRKHNRTDERCQFENALKGEKLNVEH